MTGAYRVGLTADCAEPDGTTIFGDLGRDRLTAAGLEWEVMPRSRSRSRTTRDRERPVRWA